MTRIFYNAFAYCYPLTTIAIPSSVTWLGDHAFSDCYSLSLVDLTSYTNPDKESIPHCDKNDSFENCSEDLKFKVKNEEMAHAFADSGHWWSNDINDYIY